jgi:hypothetical protein
MAGATWQQQQQQQQQQECPGEHASCTADNIAANKLCLALQVFKVSTNALTTTISIHQHGRHVHKAGTLSSTFTRCAQVHLPLLQ